MERVLGKFTLRDSDSEHSGELTGEIRISTYWLEIKLDGYGEAGVIDGTPILLELRGGKPQVHIFPDILSEEATTIDLSGAAESRLASS